MKKVIPILLLLITLSISLSAQQAPATVKDGIRQPQANAPEMRLGLGESLTISPNPVPKNHPVITVTAINVMVYSYLVYDEFGQIVELENLSGRPEGTIIDLTGSVNTGSYYVTFDTDSGHITRKFMVI